MSRYAIYYSPRQGEPIARFARSWLGRDPEMAGLCPQLNVEGIKPDRLVEITADPRHYGFHGTLKAPFRLADGMSEDDFLARLLVFAAERQPIEIERIKLKRIGDFLALVPAKPAKRLNELAADCVRDFDRFRAPLTESELERRRAGTGLSKRHDKLLTQWGYPYVFGEFRFHLTLTGALDNPEREFVRGVLTELTQSICDQPLLVRDLTVFMQDDRLSPFRIVARYPLSGTW